MLSASVSFQATHSIEPAARDRIRRFFHAVLLHLGLAASCVAIATAQTTPVDPPDVGEDRWWDGFHAPGLGVRNGWPDHSVVFLDVVHGELVVGGKLRIRSPQQIRDAARYDGTTWRALGDGPGGEIVVGTKHGDDFVCIVKGEPLRLRRWDGATWTTLSEFSVDHAENHISGHNYRVGPRVTSVASFGGAIVVGGIFDEIGGAAAENVAAWDGSHWHALGAGLSTAHPFRDSDCVTTLAVFEGSLVAGGSFSESDGGTQLLNIARWDGSRWLPLGGGLDAMVGQLVVQSGNVYAMGGFSLGGWEFPQRDRLMRWNGSGWKSLLPLLPPDFHVRSIASSPRGLAVAGITDEHFDGTIFGDFTSELLIWDGHTWEVIGEAVRNGLVLRVTEFEGSLVAGGLFLSIDDAAANGLAFLDAGEWRVPISGASLDASEDGSGFLGEARAFLPEGGGLIAGGRFVFAGERRAGGIARWTGTTWSPLARGTDGDVDALAHWNGLLVAGGTFQHASGVEASNIAAWDRERWSSFGAGFQGGPVTTLVDYQGALIAGGSFSRSGERQIYGVARWDGSLWQPMRFGLWGLADLVVYRGELLAGGTRWDGRKYLGPVARWTGDEWMPFGTIFGYVNHLRIVDDELYVTGAVKFSEARNAPVHQVARWDGAGWQAVGDRPDLQIYDIVKYGGEIVASVSYSVQYPEYTSSNGRLYRLRNGNWEPLSRALQRSIPRTLVSHGGSLYCGGYLYDVGEGRESLGIARWDGVTTDVTVQAVVAPAWSTSLEPIGLARAGQPVRIAFRAGTTGEARVEVFDVRGRKVRSVVRMHVTPGRHVIDWDLLDDHQSAVARGLYFVRLQLDGEHAVRKVVVASR